MACASATTKVLSARPIRNFPSSDRTMNFASFPWQAASSFLIIPTFLVWDYLSMQVWISCNWHTYGITAGFGNI
jgi:hypothetical protein